jgi:hypothetical protein
MKAIEAMYGRWGNYIPTDIRKQFEKDCLEAEQQLKKLKDNTVTPEFHNRILREQDERFTDRFNNQEAEIKTHKLTIGIQLDVHKKQEHQIKKLKDQRERRVKSWKKAEAEQEQQIKELGRKNAILATFLGERNRQIKELKDFAKHKDSCQYWADVKAVKSNMLPNLKPNCNCGLKQALK